MRRATDRLANETFDILIIGGGVTGACVARDASLRGLKVALIERNDFANATSAHNSKLVHGGLRYLRNFELGLVRESLRERRIWQRIAPHLVHPLPFLVPLYGGGFKARATLSAGLTLYDVLSFDRGWLDDPAQRLPGHSWLNAKEALAHEPVLDGPGLEGAFRYYDAQMYSPERLALECLIDADAHGAAISNYVEAGKLLLRDGKVEGCSARDTHSGASFDIRAKATLVAAGPWADIFLEHALAKPASHKLLRSKGIHVLVPSMTRDAALTVATAHGHFFVLPWRGHTLLGTTDTAFSGNPDNLGVSESDIATFFEFINHHLPAAKLGWGKVEYFYAGLRPLVDDGSGDTYGASRRAELIDHSVDDGMDGLFSAIGGKWTTSRDLAAVGRRYAGGETQCENARLRNRNGLVARWPRRPLRRLLKAATADAEPLASRATLWRAPAEHACRRRQPPRTCCPCRTDRRHRRAGDLCHARGNGADTGRRRHAPHRHRTTGRAVARARSTPCRASWPPNSAGTKNAARARSRR